MRDYGRLFRLISTTTDLLDGMRDSLENELQPLLRRERKEGSKDGDEQILNNLFYEFAQNLVELACKFERLGLMFEHDDDDELADLEEDNE